MNTMTALPLSTLLQHTAQALLEVRRGQSLNTVLALCPLSAKPGTQALIFEVLRQLGCAQAWRQQLVPKAPLPKIDALLTCALALLQTNQSYAEHTLVNQAVQAAKHMAPHSAGLVNAVLRRFLRERASLAMPADPVAQYNHPLWWIQQLQADWPQDWQRLLALNQTRAPMVLRVNARQSNTLDYLKRLRAQGHVARIVGPQAIALQSPCPVQELPGFAQGAVSIQDTAAQLAAHLLLQSGLPAKARVLDACAAPGGKTAHLLELADLNMVALDVDPIRLARTQDTLSRLGLSAHMQVADASEPAAWWDGQRFEAILLDAPCSGSGVVRRHPDIRWLRRASDLPALARTQAQLLDALWPLLEPGGRLLYATCSVFKAEGIDVIDAFLQRQPTAQPMKYPANLGYTLVWADNPDHDESERAAASSDGFFYALLEKIKCA